MSSNTLDVLFNGKCPVCSAEIAHYRSYCARRGVAIRFLDLHDTQLDAWQLTPMQAEKRLHVRKADDIVSGLDAFIVLWRAMPRYAMLARIAGAPLLRPAATWFYDTVLAPLLFRLHRRRQRRSAST